MQAATGFVAGKQKALVRHEIPHQQQSVHTALGSAGSWTPPRWPMNEAQAAGLAFVDGRQTRAYQRLPCSSVGANRIGRIAWPMQRKHLPASFLLTTFLSCLPPRSLLSNQGSHTRHTRSSDCATASRRFFFVHSLHAQNNINCPRSTTPNHPELSATLHDCFTRKSSVTSPR